MSDRDIVKMRAANYLYERLRRRQIGLTPAYEKPLQDCRNAVSTLMWRIQTPEELSTVGRHGLQRNTQKQRLRSTAYLRFIHMEQGGCWGFCGEKDFSFGPKDLKSGQRMLGYGTSSGGFGGGDPEIALIGIRYPGIYDTHGKNHIGLGNLKKTPVIFLHAASPYKNRPRREKWGIYIPNINS